MNIVGRGRSALNPTLPKCGAIEDGFVNISLEDFVVWENTVHTFSHYFLTSHVFGPILHVIADDSEDEAVCIANDSKYRSF
jgi:hypothetical protein